MTREFAILFGAGASKPFDIPDMKDMVEGFEKNLYGDEYSKWKEIRLALKAHIEPDLEAMLSILTDPAINPSNLHPGVLYYFKSHLSIPFYKKIKVLDTSFAKNLEEKIKQYIWNACNLKKDPEKRKKQIDCICNVYDKFFSILASKLGRSESDSGMK